MASIEVEKSQNGEGYEFHVTVREGGGVTHHRVTLRHDDYERLSGGQASPEALVTESFRFLLEYEPKEAILITFDLPVLRRYFPRYEHEIGRRLSASN
jgi:hypothetical protein